MKIDVFLFHRISPDRDENWLPVNPAHFKQIIKHLSENYEVIQLEDYLTNNAEHSVHKPLAAIVFDDGYKDILTHAVPIMADYNMPYSIYVVTDCVDSGMPTWTYQLDWLFSETKVMAVNANTNLLSFMPPPLKWSSNLERIAYGQELKVKLKKTPNEERVEITNYFEGVFSDVELQKGLMLSWDDLRKLQSKNCRIGSHTRSHPILTSLEKDEQISAELEYSRDRIKVELGQNPISISYPNGNYNKRITEIASALGYEIGLTVEQRRYNSMKDDIMGIPRIQLYQESMFKTILRMKGIVEQAKNILGR